MRVIVDGDGCPDLDGIIDVCKSRNTEVVVYADYAHCINKEDCKIIICDIGKDSADMKILNDIQRGDVLISQDYGLSSMALMKGVFVLHVSGTIIHSENIEMLLMSRYLSAKERKKNNRVKGPAARTKEVSEYFLKQLENVICKES